MDDLIEMGSITAAAATFLRACVIDRRNVLVSGGTGTGKTTMLNVLSSFIPYKERIITIEDTIELRLHQEHVVTLETKPANVEGAGEYTIRDLVKNALRMRPDRIIVGECRGGEALDMIQAMNTGHDGSMTTVHANSAEEVVERLEVLVLMAADLPGDLHPPPDRFGPGPDRAHQPHARRAPRGDADLRGRPLRSRGETDRRPRHLQLPRRRSPAADRLPADLRRFAGGQGPVGAWNSCTARSRRPLARCRPNGFAARTRHAMIVPTSTGSLAWPHRCCARRWPACCGSAGTFPPGPWTAWKRDLAEKLRRLRASTGTSARYLIAWLVVDGAAFFGFWIVLDNLSSAFLLSGLPAVPGPGTWCGGWRNGTGRRSKTSWPTRW